jgi:hypothetical protein
MLCERTIAIPQLSWTPFGIEGEKEQRILGPFPKLRRLDAFQVKGPGLEKNLVAIEL